MIFNPPIEFPVFIEGRRMMASVHEEIDHPVQTLIRVCFSDGFEDEFTIEDDGHVYGSGIASIRYARAIRFDIGHVVGIDPNRFYYIFQETVDGTLANVWVIEGDNGTGESIFKVYYHEFFRFALKRSVDKWVVSHRPADGKELNESIITQTGFMLDSLLEMKPND